MKVYVTKYALTSGISVEEVRYGSNTQDEKFVYTMENVRQQFVMGKNAFLTYKEAAVAARAMRNQKIKSVRKQLARLTDLIFPTKEPNDGHSS